MGPSEFKELLVPPPGETGAYLGFVFGTAKELGKGFVPLQMISLGGRMLNVVSDHGPLASSGNTGNNTRSKLLRISAAVGVARMILAPMVLYFVAYAFNEYVLPGIRTSLACADACARSSLECQVWRSFRNWHEPNHNLDISPVEATGPNPTHRASRRQRSILPGKSFKRQSCTIGHVFITWYWFWAPAFIVCAMPTANNMCLGLLIHHAKVSSSSGVLNVELYFLRLAQCIVVRAQNREPAFAAMQLARCLLVLQLLPGSAQTPFTTRQELYDKAREWTNGDQAVNDDIAIDQGYGVISAWDVPQVTDMRSICENFPTFKFVENMAYMFAGATAFNNGAAAPNQPLKLDTAKVTDMAHMFETAANFNQPLECPGSCCKWDISSVTNMRRMFSGALAFTQPSNGTHRVCSPVEGLVKGMFLEAAAFNQPLNSWDISRVSNLYQMFKDAAVFSQRLASWDTSAVTDQRVVLVAFTTAARTVLAKILKPTTTGGRVPACCVFCISRSTMADLIGSGRSIAAATTAMQLMAAPASPQQS
ncbi:unnamed protein product [Symbiodinium sp. CCMP2456]|nr:unnamed protein product [Symbiodinium sp. CCMP2456]